MPKVIPVRENPSGDQELYIVSKDGSETQAYVLDRHEEAVYVHYVNKDKRLDEWVPEESHGVEGLCEDEGEGTAGLGSAAAATPAPAPALAGVGGGVVGTGRAGAITATEEELDIEHQRQITAKRNFEKVVFGRWQIRTWYFSPYPLSEEADETAAPSARGQSSSVRGSGVARPAQPAHGRTSDLFVGGATRSSGLGHNATLWVCDRCFKYMADGISWELHIKKCARRSPPGRKVYQRGAHIIWEVDGAKEKLYCQNLSLFGKLFIDIKTLFFDCDNFLFYIVTDADSQRDHVLGFFSKEKVSFDDYNLACIVVLPPYQKKGYGMLLIEFSYELSRRAGKVGTPERPLSDLGLRSYLTYWVATLVRFFRRLLSVMPLDTAQVVSDALAPSPARDTEGSSRSSSLSKKRRKSMKGWDGEELPHPLWTQLRTIETTANADGSATSHVVARCTLADVARATNLRVEDVAFALNECGLLGARGADAADAGAPVVVTREAVERVARERDVKRTCIDLAHVLL
ncbi:acyl-CoA N-acyltransferase [Epithele typhae]|uniref:acyl-CoA N-acyltransferase n=1 Tax=Epithele typhae TaxID=378194 RepID=UPI002007D444|nr:acyl-CoA N-acyltransferase [Epithele typhae]KAH9939012.1 acyl-CoA N-acyltransferase [Epithele typhae]